MAVTRTKGTWSLLDCVLVVGFLAGAIAATITGIHVFRPYLKESKWKEADECRVEKLNILTNENDDGTPQISIGRNGLLVDYDDYGIDDVEDEFEVPESEESPFEPLDNKRKKRSDASGHMRGLPDFNPHEGKGHMNHRFSSEEDHERLPGPQTGGGSFPSDEDMGESMPSEQHTAQFAGLFRSMSGIGDIQPCLQVVVSYQKPGDPIRRQAIFHRNLKEKKSEDYLCTVTPDIDEGMATIRNFMSAAKPYMAPMMENEPITCYYRCKKHGHQVDREMMWQEFEDDTKEDRGRDKRHSPREDDREHVLGDKIYSRSKAMAALIIPTVISAVCFLILVGRRIHFSRPVRTTDVTKYEEGQDTCVKTGSVWSVKSVDNCAKAKEAWASEAGAPATQVVLAPSYDEAMQVAPPSYVFVATQTGEKPEKEPLPEVEGASAEKF